ncbi:MAG: hypothetical protein ACLU4N_02440 [Butyricimonas faecihominis]
MSKLIYLFAVVYIVFSFVGCDQDIDFPYEEKTGFSSSIFPR